MNYIRLMSKGVRYSNEALYNWDSRKSKLISAWVRADRDYKKKTPKRKRINGLIDILDERMNLLSKAIFQLKENQKNQEFEAQHQFIMLECPDSHCRWRPDAIGVAVKIKDYEPSKLKCDNCGKELLSKEDRDLDLMLFDLGICHP